MSTYTRDLTVNFGATQTGLSTVAYSLDGGTTWTTGATEIIAGTGAYTATATLTYGQAYRVIWRTASSAGKYAFEDLQPVQLDMNQVVPVRSQDGVTVPTVGDSHLGAWTEPFAKESADAATGSYVKKKPDNSGPVRSYTLTTDINGNVTAR